MLDARLQSGSGIGVGEMGKEKRSKGESGANSLATSSEKDRLGMARVHNGKAEEQDLDRWKEEDEHDGFEVPAMNLSRSGRDSVGGDGDGILKRERAKRAVTSESWDDDFLFQHDPAPPPSPNRLHSRPPSRATRPTTPLPPQPNLLSPARPISQPPAPSFLPRTHINVPAPPSSRTEGLSGLDNPSLDSLVSSLDWSVASDHEPTLTIHSNPTLSAPLARPPSSEYHRGHQPNLSTSTARPATASSQQTFSPPKPHLPPRPSPRPISYNPPSRTPSNATTNRSETPSLTADSLRSLTSTTTGDELRTETEDDETEDERRTSSMSNRPSLFGLKRWSQEIISSPPTSPTLKASNSKRWRFGRTKKEPSETKENGPSGGIFGRRTGPREPEQVSIIHQTENDHYLRRSGLPLPVRDGQFVVLGRRGRTSAGGSASRNSVEAVDGVPVRPAAPSRSKHSSGTSTSTTSTNSTGNVQSRPQRNSLHFLPMSLGESSPAVPQSPHLPPNSHSWQQYDGTTDDREDETTEAEMSEFSGDERFHLPTSHSRLDDRRRRSLATNTPSTSYSSTSPTSPSESARPNSPVESILGDRIGRWNTSQVSFVSASSAFSPHQITETVSTGYDTTRPDDIMRNRQRKLVKRRPDSEDATYRTPPTLAIDDGAGHRPLLSPGSSRSSASSKPLSPTSTLHPPPSHGHRQSPSLPFAQDSDAEVAQRPKFARRRSSTTPGKIPSTSTERGQVVDIDSGWLGIVPFPPSPRPSLDSRDSSSIPPLPPLPSPSSLRPSSSASRKASGAVKSHPPVTGRTQAESKTKRSSGGIGQSISNMLSRSTSALPLAGSKRAPSPAPSAKSGKSNRSILTRSGSKKAKKPDIDEGNAQSTLPKSPSLSLLKKRSSAVISPSRDPPPTPNLSSTKRPTSTSSNATSSPLKPSTRPNPSFDQNRPIPPISSSPSLLNRARGLSRSTNSNEANSATPSSPVKRYFSTSRMPPPPVPSHTSISRASTSRRCPNQHSSTKGQLNTTFKMPRNGTTASSEAKTSATSALPPRPEGKPPSSLRIKQRPSPQTRSGQAGHRPSLSLSSIMRSPSPSPRALPPPVPSSASTTPIDLSPPRTPYERPQTALGTDRPPTSYYFDETLLNEEDFILPRRNSLSDLRIPARITNAQKKIEEDLERVKQFAKGIEDLKALHRQYEQLLQIFVEPPSLLGSLTPRHSMDLSTIPVNNKVAHGVRRVEIDYSHWWEQAKTLIDLGDGKPQQPQRTSPGTLASRRDRCVSMAPEASPSKSSHRLSAVSGSETETEESYSSVRNSMSSRPGGLLLRGMTEGGKETRKGLSRMPSASSIETEASVGARQREMLRGVLAPAIKGASLPSRGPPSPRPGLAVLAQVEPDLQEQPRSPPLTSPTKRPPFALQYPSSSTSIRQKPNSNRRVSRVGVSGIREFLLRLRTRATQELANSVGSLPPSSDLTSAPSSIISAPPRRSVSDPSTRPSTPSHSRRPTPSSLLQHVAASASESSSRGRSHSSSSEEDWDAELSPPRNSLIEIDNPSSPSSSSLRRGRTVSAGRPSTPSTARTEMMMLTTENMPQLLDKVKEVQENCENCIDILKGLTL